MKNSEMKNPAECWSAGVMGRWSNSSTHNPITPPLHHCVSQPNRAQSSPIKPNQAISCLGVMQPQPSSCSKIATFPIHPRQPPSKQVKASQSVSQSLPSGHGSSRHHDILRSPRPNAQPMVVAFFAGHYYGANLQSAIHNRWRPPPATLQFCPNKAR
jgi:hypothetical protein